MKLFLLLYLVHQSTAIIYKLNFTEFSKMPDLFQMDDYDKCMVAPGGTYCLADAVLYSKDDSQLMQMILEYSEYTKKHFNHTVVHRAMCVQETCKAFIKNRSLENETDLGLILEECIDDSMWKEYKLNARLKKINYCKRHGQNRPLGAGDYIMGIVYLSLIAINAVGTVYDMVKGENAKNPYLLAFSMRKNWRKLVAPSGVGPDPRLNRLTVFNGLRTMTMVCVFFSHTALVMVFSYLKNPYYIETSYEDPGKFILFNGTLVTYTFFVMSGFLLAFNFELHAEKHRVTLWDWPKGMLMRWLRLTPTYALIIFTIMTLMRHLGDGPLWDLLVSSEAPACNQYWWTHFLYINNYIYDNSHCFPQSWYLAADTQLFGVGLLLCILFRKWRPQLLALSIMLIISILIPAAHTYFQDLEAVVLQSPEVLRSIYHTDDTYRLVFVRGHTNLSTYTLGIAGGLLAYHWLKNDQKISARLQKFPWVMWLTFPVGVGLILTGGIFYIDGFEPSTLLRVLYACLNKPIFQAVIIVIILACIFRVENTYRGIVEWRGFSWMARCTYSAFLVHGSIQRGLIGAGRQPTFMSDYYVLTILASTIFLSYGLGALLWITVESPLAQVSKAALAPPRRVKVEPNEEITTKV
ncbi:nose resistant to fluoxetine protein 6-like [Cydia pomonella]|uniref:nose resistant to fluoxetine protein 6-like n=1 Tax=Cydia pomonella TaxID=82600 RepID=UPI002ADDF728|nr:nose resistant to fluoxetine protein 6-like [Cydia pomonella]